jgi:hypothetical protein
MSACNFSLSEYDGDCAEFHNVRTVTARREHKCCECGRVIQRGDRYESVVGKWEDEISRYRTCPLCVEIREKFNSGGCTYTTIWEEIRDYLFPEMNFKCMDGLSTEARNFILARWQQWKGLTA